MFKQNLEVFYTDIPMNAVSQEVKIFSEIVFIFIIRTSTSLVPKIKYKCFLRLFKMQIFSISDIVFLFACFLISTEKLFSFDDNAVYVNDCLRHLKFPGKHVSYSNTAQANENLYPVNLGNDRDHKPELIQKGK